MYASAELRLHRALMTLLMNLRRSGGRYLKRHFSGAMAPENSIDRLKRVQVILDKRQSGT